MAEDGWSTAWIVGALGVGCYVGYKLVPAMQRVEDTEKLEMIAQKLYDISDGSVKMDALQQLKQIQRYRQGIMSATDESTDEEHMTMVKKIKKHLLNTANKLNPLTKKDRAIKAEAEKALADSDS